MVLGVTMTQMRQRILLGRGYSKAQASKIIAANGAAEQGRDIDSRVRRFNYQTRLPVIPHNESVV